MNFDRPNRPIALKNLEIAFPEKTPAARLNILRKMYRSWGSMLAEWTHFRELSRANVERVATYEGKENWDEAERRCNGHGILVLTAHYGNFELMQTRAIALRIPSRHRASSRCAIRSSTRPSAAPRSATATASSSARAAAAR